MKVRIQVTHGQIKIDETVQGNNAEEVVSIAKGKTAAKLPFAMRFVVNSMTPAAFMQEIVKRYNAEIKPPVPIPVPATADEFIQSAVKIGVATVLEP
jgi:hypothetical protein